MLFSLIIIITVSRVLLSLINIHDFSTLIVIPDCNRRDNGRRAPKAVLTAFLMFETSSLNASILFVDFGTISLCHAPIIGDRLTV